MPPTLDLTRTYTHADMVLSARKSPRLSVRRPSPSGIEKGPLSSTSSRFSFHDLPERPLPSPGLPPSVPRHRRPVPLRAPRRYILAWISGVLMMLYLGYSVFQQDRPTKAVGWATHSGEEYEMVGESELPDFPTPVVITDKRGRSKWTVSIPPNSDFPLEPKQYAEICSQNMEVASHVADSRNRVHKEHAAHFGYYHVDKNFMDVAEAEAYGLLPGPKAKTNMKESPLLGESLDGLVESEVCEKSMTFLLETQDSGLGGTLLMLWTAYGLAEKEGRAFFVDDSRWAYGKYNKLFKPPPIPSCRPPPRHEMLPCPHHARHLVVSAATAGVVFGGGFNGYYEDARKMEVYRQKPIFNFARAGYEALFQLDNEDEEYVDKRIAEIRSKTVIPGEEKSKGLVVGMHVRHGDKHPFEFQYKDSYIPLEKYVSTAKEILRETFNGSKISKSKAAEAVSHSVMLLASDDPDVYAAEEMSDALPAQVQIKLASNKHISTPPQENSGMRSFVDQPVGWEGGFFAPMFWSLGKPNSLPATAVATPDIKLPPTEEALRLRELVGRAYLMDLAVLGQASDKIVCTVSSAGCRILAVMLGWEKSFDQAGFINVDGTFDWRGISW